MEKTCLKVGSRGSPLALIQIKEIESLLKAQGIDLSFNVISYKTTGDVDKKTSLIRSQDDDFFTDTIDKALLRKQIDIAIHSAKDLPQQLISGLEILALSPSLDTTDAFVGKAKLRNLKRGAKIGTSSLVRQQSLKKLYPQLIPVDIRGTIQERIALIDKGYCDGVIVATAALKRLGLEHLIKEIMPWEATPLQGQLAVVGRRENPDLKVLFSKIDVRKKYGNIYLVGAGPGAPDLITVKGTQALKKADCIFYDYLADKALLNYAPEAEKIYVGKRKGKHSLSQEALSRMLKEKAIQGKTVVRLKGGDPLIFGRGAEEITYLRSYHINVEVIPGVSSATALPSLLGIPLTARGVSSSVAFLSAHSEEEKTESLKLLDIPKTDTLVFLMGLTKLDIIVRSLLSKKWSSETPIVIISRGTHPDEKIIVGTLKTIVSLAQKASLKAPALTVVGEIVKFYHPHNVSTVLYTGTNPERYTNFGNIIPWPMIEIKKKVLNKKKLAQLKRLAASCDLILLTSRFGVKYFFELARKEKMAINHKKFITIGSDSAQAIRLHNIEPAFVSTHEHSQGLLQEIISKVPNLKGQKILFPRSALPNLFLKNNLEKLGAKVFELPIYDNVKPPKRRLPDQFIDTVIFTSPSTVKNFLKDYDTIPSYWKIYAKGPLTQKTLEEKGYPSESLS